MDWYAHSIEQEKESIVEENKVKGVIDEITSSIGNILEENFSGIIRDVEEINKLYKRSNLFKSMFKNENLKTLELKSCNTFLERRTTRYSIVFFFK